MACGVCGKTGTPLHDLLPSYQTTEIKAICPDCECVVNKQLDKIREATNRIQMDWLKRFMQNRKSQHDKQN